MLTVLLQRNFALFWFAGLITISITNVKSSDSCRISEVASVYGWGSNLYNTAVASLNASLGAAFYL